MPGPRDATRTKERREKVARLYLQGHLQSEIARALLVTQSCISKDLDGLREQWLSASIRNFDTAKEEELRKISHVEHEAWGSFTRSKDDSESTVEERNNGRDKVSRRVEKQVGDPRWLQVVMSCVEKRCQILGLNAATRFKIDWDNLTDQQLTRLSLGDPIRDVLNSAPTDD